MFHFFEGFPVSWSSQVLIMQSVILALQLFWEKIQVKPFGTRRKKKTPRVFCAWLMCGQSFKRGFVIFGLHIIFHLCPVRVQEWFQNFQQFFFFFFWSCEITRSAERVRISGKSVCSKTWQLIPKNKPVPEAAKRCLTAVWNDLVAAEHESHPAHQHKRVINEHVRTLQSPAETLR